MRMLLLSLVIFGQALLAHGQKVEEERLDVNLQPTEFVPRYMRTVQKRADGWYEELKYYPEKTTYTKGLYKDEACQLAEGEVTWYYPNRVLKSKGMYSNGKLNGVYETYSESGKLASSATYVDNQQKGPGLSYKEDGSVADSSFFDGAGNGSFVSFGPDHQVDTRGSFTSGNKRSGTWTYYYPDGKVKATEDYNNDKVSRSTCYDAAGNLRGSNACVSKEAIYGTTENDWASYISKNLDPAVPVKGGAPLGRYTVSVKFMVDTDGSLKEIKPMTKYGYGMEQEVMRMLRKSPKWTPALQLGEPVKAWRIQPITFEVSKG